MQLEEQSGSSPELESEVNQATEASKPGETEDNLLSVVQSVLEKSNEAEDTESLSESPTDAQSEQGSETELEPTDPARDEDDSKLPFNKHPRFRELVREKNTYKAQVVEYEADAKQYRDIQAFMQTNGLTAEEVANTLGMLAQMKSGDPAAAYEMMRGRLEELALAAGKKLPQDLEERVEQGFVDRETAQQMYQRQVQAERQAALAQSQLQQRSYQDAQTQVVNIANAVQTWEQQTKVTDPDFEIKVDLVKDRVRAHVAANGMPRTPDEALKVTKEAYESVTQVLRRAQGPKQSMRPAVGGKVNGSAAPEPRNLLDVIRRVSAGA
jgi:hypothetical protein